MCLEKVFEGNALIIWKRMKQVYSCKDYLKNQNDEKSAKSYSLWEDKYKNVAYFILL